MAKQNKSQDLEKLSEILSNFETEILRASCKIESFGSLVEQQASSDDGREDYLGLGFALVDIAKELRSASDQIGTLACKVGGGAN